MSGEVSFLQRYLALSRGGIIISARDNATLAGQFFRNRPISVVLHHALFLLNQCNLVRWDSADDTFWITDAGEARLAAYIPHSDSEAAAR